MKKVCILTIVVLFVALTNCTEKEDYVQISNNPLTEPATTKVFCQANPEVCYQETKYEYDNNLLISEKVFYFGELNSQKTFEYNSNGQLKKEIYDMISWIQEKDFIYNTTNQLEKIIYTNIYYNSDREEIYSRTQSEETFEYRKNLLVKHVANWGGLDTYEYDTKDRMITHTNYNMVTGERYHIIHYKYSGNLKIEEWTEVVETGKIMYRHKFEYDKNNRLTQVLEDGKIIEENLYRGDKLIEKRTSYFGIDPCFYPCCGKCIYKYEY